MTRGLPRRSETLDTRQRGMWARPAMLAALVAASDLVLPTSSHADVHAVFPILECVEHNVPSLGQYTAHWGYDNKAAFTVNIPISSVLVEGEQRVPRNYFTPDPIDRGQPVDFLHGRQIGVFVTQFDGSDLVWSLSGPDGHARTVTASSNPILRCSVCGDHFIATGEGEHCDEEHGRDKFCDDEDGEGEHCDDGDTEPGDGCNATCQVEDGWTCSGSPSSCSPSCADGIITGSESCDDGNTRAGDGCSTTCQVESGFLCTGAPSVCSLSCGNGTINGSESCDDRNMVGGDGCDAVCQTETGWSCAGEPSVCVPTCGDDLMTGGEQCDDGGLLPNDGCTDACQVEPGWTCAGVPSECVPTCGDGLLTGNESCDDGNSVVGDGCGITCVVEQGWACTGTPSVCRTTCGDGIVTSGELCDDANVSNGDGCDAFCQTEPGWSCSGALSACSANCGDGFLSAVERCDDGDLVSGDGCSGSCQVEPGAAAGSLVLGSASLRKAARSGSGSVSVAGVLKVLDTQSGFEASALAGLLTMRVQDGAAYDAMVPLTGCVVSGVRRNIVCKSSPRGVNARFRTVVGPFLGQYVYALTASASGLLPLVPVPLTPPPGSSVTVTLHESSGIDRADVIGDRPAFPCKQSATIVRCRER